MVVDACVAYATGPGEWAAARVLLAALPPIVATIGADKAYGVPSRSREPGSSASRRTSPRVSAARSTGRTTGHPGLRRESTRASKRFFGVDKDRRGDCASCGITAAIGLQPGPAPEPASRGRETVADRTTLEQWTRRRTTAQALALRARIVLRAATGQSNTVSAG